MGGLVGDPGFPLRDLVLPPGPMLTCCRSPPSLLPSLPAGFPACEPSENPAAREPRMHPIGLSPRAQSRSGMGSTEPRSGKKQKSQHGSVALIPT